MIAKISGNLAHKAPGEVIVDVGGVGYHVFVSLGVFYRLPEVGRAVSLHIHTHVREDALQLFGFLEQGEKQLFLLLNGVAGIGPKLAINILSGIPSDELARALREGDQPRLVSIPGVGRKLAERLIVELREPLRSVPAAGDGKAAASQLLRDAVSALVNLGYRQTEAEQAVRNVAQREGPLEEILKEALRRLGQ
jgi:Holliday junction DNA helicase RuvA